MPGWTRARRLLGSDAADLVVAVVLSGVSALDVLLSGFEPVSAVSAAVGTVPLAIRRRAPTVPPFAVLAAVLLQRASGAPVQSLFVLTSFQFAALLAAYTAAAHGSAPRAVMGGLLVALGLGLGLRWTNAPTDEFMATAATLAVAWLAGRRVRVHRRRAGQLRALAALLERERAASGWLAVAEERTRMARELHDAIAHVVTLMVVQAAAAEALIASAPARSREALCVVENAGRDAVTELRAMLRILRAPDDEPRPAPPAAELALAAPRGRARMAWSPRLDTGLALLCLAVAEAAVMTEAGYGGLERPISALLMVVATLPLAVRSRFPAAVVVTVVGAVALQRVIVDPEWDTPTALTIAPLIALYTVAAHASGRRALGSASVCLLIAWMATTVISGHVVPWDLVDLASLVAVPALCGRAVRVHRRQAEQLRTLTARLERERAALARLAVVEERTRVARDLHDTIAHGLGIMVLQAAGAQQVLTSDPDATRHALRAIQDAGRTVIDELGRLLAVLRPDEADTPRAPRPGLGQLDELVAHVRRAGLRVDLRFEGRRTRLPVGIDVSTYRIIQEGLTNALRHAGPVATAVTLRYEPRVFTVEIRNARGRGRAPHGDGRARADRHARARRDVRRRPSSRSRPRRRLYAAGAPATATGWRMIRILIADDEVLMRGGLRMILDAQPDFEVVGEASDGREALAMAGELAPDLVLMDIRMPRLDGLETTRRLLTEAGPKVLVLTTFDLDEYVYEAIRAGASGFLLKSSPPEQLVGGVRAVMAGDALLSPQITRRLLDRFIQRPPPSAHRPPELADLSERELEVLRLIADGHSNAEIAAALFRLSRHRCGQCRGELAA